MSESNKEIALIVGGGGGISASCARAFAADGMQVVMAARTIDKPALTALADEHGIQLYACDASLPHSVAALFARVTGELGRPRLVVHNIDGRVMEILRKTITAADPTLTEQVYRNGAYSAFLVGQQAARVMGDNAPDANGARGTIVFTNASAALKGFPQSAAFAMSCRAKAGLAESMARELMPQGIHVANVPIDAAVGVPTGEGERTHHVAGPAEEDNMAHPDHIAALYLQLHRQHRSTWAFEIVVRPWNESW